MDKEVLDQTPPGGTVYGGLGPAHGSAKDLSFLNLAAGQLKIRDRDQANIALDVMMISAKAPGSISVELLTAAENTLKEYLSPVPHADTSS
jgi:hypothetical protein